MIFTSNYTGKEIDKNIHFTSNHTDVIKILTLISLASTKGGTLTIKKDTTLTVAIMDSEDNLIACADEAGEYIGMAFDDVVSYIVQY